MGLLHLDFETYGVLDLKKAGLYRYLSHPRTELLLAQWAVDDSPIQVQEASSQTVLSPELEALVRDSRHYIVAFNAAFERAALKFLCGIDLPPERFICTQALAYHFSYAGSLSQVCDQLELPQDLRKMGADGRSVMLKFAKPRRPSQLDPSTRWNKHNASSDWPAFLQYAEFDVVASRAIWAYFADRYPDYLHTYWWPEERPLWVIDQRINERGWPLDSQLVSRACVLYLALKTRMREALDQLTGLANSNSRDQFLGWLSARGYVLDNLQEATRTATLQNPTLPPDVRHALTEYGFLQKATPDKFLALERAMHAGRIKGTLAFAGASRTNRWAGRVFQPQNLYSARSWAPEDLDQLCANLNTLDLDTLSILYPDTMEALSAAIRPAVMAGPGKVLVVVDLSAIEARVLGWLSGCRRIINLFAAGLDTYKDLASRYFRTPVSQVTKAQRTFAKPADLGCGYRLGGPGLVKYAESMGVRISDEAATALVAIWRDISPEVVEMWRDYERAAEAVTTYRMQSASVHRVTFTRDDVHLMAELPSGRRIFYRNPVVKEGRFRMGFHYDGRDDKGFAFWGQREMHGGPWTENFDQAISRDILGHALKLIDVLPHCDIVGHVHDEPVLEAEEGYADVTLAAVTSILCTPPVWAQDLILDAGGHILKRYKKL